MFSTGFLPGAALLPRLTGAQVAPSCGAIFPLAAGPTTAEVRLAGPPWARPAATRPDIKSHGGPETPVLHIQTCRPAKLYVQCCVQPGVK